MSQVHRARMQRAAGLAAEAGLDGVLLTPGADLLRLTGYDAMPLERLTLLVLPATGPASLVVPGFEAPLAEEAGAGDLADIIGWSDGQDPYALAARLLGSGRRFAMASQAWASHLLGLQRAVPGASFVATEEALPLLRAVKDAAELDLLQAAARSADAAYRELLGRPFGARTEDEVAGDLDAALRRNGHHSVDFITVGSGANGASPHHAHGRRRIAAGDAVVLDFGGLVDGYASDTTRVVSVGDPPAEVAEVHEIVRRAQQAAFEAVRPGVACQEVDRAARRVISEAGYGEAFTHRTGHGVGMTIHEPPYIVEGEETPLVEGMCFSIEPGIYLDGRFGVRIEDLVVLTADGARRLQSAPRDLAVVA
jgi:Xaa-Pro aminopeptidase